MKKIASAALVAMMLVLPASAQTLSTMLPTLTWPDETITTSTKGCTPQTVCTLEE